MNAVYRFHRKENDISLYSYIYLSHCTTMITIFLILVRGRFRIGVGVDVAVETEYFNGCK